MFAAKDGLVGFAVVLEGPHGIPEIFAGAGDHAPFASGAEDFVLAETPGGHIAKAAYRLTVDAGAMGLGAVFDHGDAVGTGQIANGGHVCWPTAQVHHGDGFGAWGDKRCNGGGGDRT